MAKNYFGITDTGKSRKNNEDAFIAENVSGEFIAACVIDGVGGYAGGEVAARIAHDVILNTLQRPGHDVVKRMNEALILANNEIAKQKKVDESKGHMACVVTLALADLNNNKFYYAHVGDTRLYLLRDHTLVKITKDHSFVGFLEDNGRLTEEAAMRHPKRNEINKALGFDAEVNAEGYIEMGESPFLPGDILLLCSDGLSDMIGNKEITAILDSNRSLAEKSKTLVAAANDAGGKDNITVVLVHNDKVPVKQEATKPAMILKQSDEHPTAEVVKPSTDNPYVALVKNKKRSSAVSVLTVLCVILLGAFLWLLYQGYHKKEIYREQVASTVTKKQRNEQEQQLVDSINSKTAAEIFVLNMAGGQPIRITDSLIIGRDSLHILGNGVTLVGDTSYSGPAFLLSPSCKYVLLDSLTLENFNVGVLVQKGGLHLKNVQFKNCDVPVLHHISFPDSLPISGYVPDVIFFKTDTLPK